TARGLAANPRGARGAPRRGQRLTLPDRERLGQDDQSYAMRRLSFPSARSRASMLSGSLHVQAWITSFMSSSQAVLTSRSSPAPTHRIGLRCANTARRRLSKSRTIPRGSKPMAERLLSGAEGGGTPSHLASHDPFGVRLPSDLPTTMRDPMAQLLPLVDQLYEAAASGGWQ